MFSISIKYYSRNPKMVNSTHFKKRVVVLTKGLNNYLLYYYSNFDVADCREIIYALARIS